jgi:hypothetical protein
MKRLASKLLAAAALAGLTAATTQASSPTRVSAPGATQMAAAGGGGTPRPPAPAVWSFRVEYRTRRSPQFSWGPWRHYTTIRGQYNTARRQADNVADFLEGRSKNIQARILERRIR